MHRRWIPGAFLAFLLLLGAGTQNPSPDILRKQCDRCHQEQAWTPLRKQVDFDHTQTRFPLSGRHRGLACGACHTGNTWQQVHAFEDVPTDCWACHSDVHQGGLGDQCDVCHRTDSWSLVREKEIHETVNFPLIGNHYTLPCEACHRNAGSHAYSMTTNECVGCHHAEYQRALAEDPPHPKSTLCEMCHEPNGWEKTGTFAHVVFPIRSGAHAMPCMDCHTRQDYTDYSCNITCHFSSCGGFQEIEAHRSVGCPEPAQHECYHCHSRGTRWTG